MVKSTNIFNFSFKKSVHKRLGKNKVFFVNRIDNVLPFNNLKTILLKIYYVDYTKFPQ